MASEVADGLDKLKLEDSYRDFLHGDSEKETVWRHGSAPRYDVVNKVFESQRTKEWKAGSLEATVQNLVKSWEMELTHKTRLQDFKTIDAQNFSLSVNGGRAIRGEELLRMGSYNALLEAYKGGSYDASKETFETSHIIFQHVFPTGFALEVLEVYSGPPSVAFKWRHWGKMEGSFTEHNPSGQVVEIVGITIAKVNSELKIGSLEVFYDPSQFLSQLCSCPFKS